jgi:LysM repeat protein
MLEMIDQTGKEIARSSLPEFYVVKKGDSINGIAAKFIILPWQLRVANGMKPGVIIHPGQKLKIPKIKWKPYEGLASYYGDQGGLFHGKSMANGEIYNQNDFVAAHRHYPFGLKLKITNLLNNKWIIVTVKDRGPYVATDKRQIDLSVAAAKKLGMYEAGTAPVRIEPLSLS